MLSGRGGFLLTDALIAVVIVSVMSVIVYAAAFTHVSGRRVLEERIAADEESLEARMSAVQICGSACTAEQEQ